MANIELVIEIPEEDYDNIKLTGENTIGLGVLLNLRQAVKYGTPLPKGHGRLGDLDKVADNLKASRDGYDYYEDEHERGMYDGYDYSLNEVMNALTIIEADKESEGKDEKL